MKVSRNLKLSCLALCFAVLFSGCSLLSSGNKEPAPAANDSSTKENKPNPPDAERDGIKDNIDTIKNEITEQTKKRDAAVRKILNLKDDTTVGNVSLPKAENFCKDEGAKNSSDCRDFLDSRNKLEVKNNELAAEQNKLKNIQPKPTIPKADETVKDDGFLWKMLLWLGVGLVGLAILVGLGFLIQRLISNTIDNERGVTNQDVDLVKKDNQKLGQKIIELEKTIKLQSGQFTKIQTAIQSLQKQISEVGGRPQQAMFTPPVVYKPEPQFPVSAEDYINKVRQTAQTASVDNFNNILVADPNGGNEFLIVRDTSLSEGVFYAVPNVERFSTRSDYSTYYKNFYLCENPAGGTVWIKSPTSVRRVEGGWQLEEMGELEIRT